VSWRTQLWYRAALPCVLTCLCISANVNPAIDNPHTVTYFFSLTSVFSISPDSAPESTRDAWLVSASRALCDLYMTTTLQRYHTASIAMVNQRPNQFNAAARYTGASQGGPSQASAISGQSRATQLGLGLGRGAGGLGKSKGVHKRHM
jgi:hypothetical protein